MTQSSGEYIYEINTEFGRCPLVSMHCMIAVWLVSGETLNVSAFNRRVMNVYTCGDEAGAATHGIIYPDGRGNRSPVGRLCTKHL
jgi:hypothetical protein